jgi:hypothetical protein
MTFWHNDKYDVLDHSFTKGDPLRGMPALHFPWLLDTLSTRDSQGDLWTIKWYCNRIENAEYSQKLKSHLHFQAQCEISALNLKKMNLDSQRLFLLELKEWNVLKEELNFHIESPFEKIKDKAKEIGKLFFVKIQKKYTFEQKKEGILNNIKQRPVSSFS